MLKPLARHLMDCHQFYGVAHALKKKQPLPFDIRHAKRFLCLQMNAIGDAIMTQPAWAAIGEAIPDATVDLACNAHIAPLFEKDPTIQQIHPLGRRRYPSWLFDRNSYPMNLLKENPYDLIIDFSALPLTALLCARGHNIPSLGFQRRLETTAGRIDLGPAYDLTVPYSETIHLRVLMGKAVQAIIGPEQSIPSPRIHLAEAIREQAAAGMSRLGLKKKAFILVHPGTKWEPKSWPIQHWQQAIHLLRNKLNLPALILGGPMDRDKIEAIIHDGRGHETPHYICEDICLSAALIEAAQLCLCHDSAPMHLAAALGVKTIALFGPVSPARSAPPEQEGTRSLYHELFCSPCSLYYSRERCRRGLNFCMHALKPDEVACAVQELLNVEASHNL